MPRKGSSTALEWWWDLLDENAGVDWRKLYYAGQSEQQILASAIQARHPKRYYDQILSLVHLLWETVYH